MPVLNSYYKHCMCILTLPECNAYFTDQIFTIYRPEKVWNNVKSTNRTFLK